MDPRVTELHYIMPIGNVPSVMVRGILSHERAARVVHHSVALPPVQERRDQKSVPRGRRLHEYANLYFDARNPMMFKRQETVATLCVLRVSPAVLDLPGAVITDSNASSDFARFLAPTQWPLLSFDDILATDWRHPGNPVRFLQHRSRKGAEVLVPERVEPELIVGAYVVDQAAEQALRSTGFALPVEIQPALFRDVD